MIKDQIQSLQPNFTKSEVKLADFVIKYMQDIPNYSINFVSKSVGVADSTVMNFCRKIGYLGFSDLKTSILKETIMLENKTIQIYEEKMSTKDSLSESIQKIVASYNDSITLTTESLSNSDIILICKKLFVAKRIRFYGIGASATIVYEASHRFQRICDTVVGFTDGHGMLVDASRLEENDIVFVFTYSGETADIIEAVKIAKENKATIVVISYHIKSKVCEYADFTIFTIASEHELVGSSIFLKIPQLLILDILYIEYLKHLDHVKILKLKKTLEIMRSKKY